jgi:glyceronephosphate O-acyltransferase
VKCNSEKHILFPYLPEGYLDFLLLSLLCYHRRIQLPAICAADDFQSSRLLGEALRRCGAFFIRRRSNEVISASSNSSNAPSKFAQNSLYWAVFAEYVQQHLLGADRPLEFFPEGQRSRTGKSVFPRAGLLQLVLEPFLRGQLYDTVEHICLNSWVQQFPPNSRSSLCR